MFQCLDCSRRVARMFRCSLFGAFLKFYKNVTDGKAAKVSMLLIWSFP